MTAAAAGSDDEDIARSKSIRDLSQYVGSLTHAANDDGAVRALTHSYINELRHADSQEKRWRSRYYGARIIILVAATSITVISGISIGGQIPLAARIAILALGALATITTSLLDVFHVLNRWRMYRVLRYRLLDGGIEVAQQTRSADQKASIDALATRLATAMTEFENAYITQIATEGTPRKT